MKLWWGRGGILEQWSGKGGEGELCPKIQKFSSVWQSMDGNNSSNVFQPHFPGALILCSRISLRGEKQPTYTALETKSKWEAYLVLYLYIKHCFVVSFNVWINKNNSAFLVSGIVTYWIIFPFHKTFPRRDDAETFLGVGQAWECEQGGNWQQRNAQSVSPPSILAELHNVNFFTQIISVQLNLP